MAIKRNVRTGRTIYGRRPAPVPKKRGGGRPSGDSIKTGAKVVVGLLAVFGLWRFFAVSEVMVTGVKVIPAAEIVTEINNSFDHHKFSKNLLTLDLAPLADDVLKDQRISDVVVKRHWPNKIEAMVKERQLSLVWASSNKIYLLDSNGVAVVQLGAPIKNLPLVTDTTGLPVKVGDRVVTGRFVQFVGGVVGGLKPQTGLTALALSVPDTTTELDVKTGVGYVVKFDTQSRVEEQLASLKTVLSTLVKLRKTPTQYIDLRIPGKAYYL